MASRASPQEAAESVIESIGLGYDIAIDLRLKYCKNESSDPRLIELDEEQCQNVVLPGGLVIPNVSKSIKCDKGERIRFRSDVLSFQQMAEQCNQEISLSGKIPSGLFNAMFELSGCWQKDAANTKALAFDGWFITIYTVALTKSQMVLRDHVKQAVPPSWDPAALAKILHQSSKCMTSHEIPKSLERRRRLLLLMKPFLLLDHKRWSCHSMSEETLRVHHNSLICLIIHIL